MKRTQLDCDNLHLVVLDEVFRHQSPLVLEYFNRLLQLRHSGYTGKYPENHLPCDTVDFIARHYLLCTHTPFGNEVVAGIRKTYYSRSQSCGIEIPLLRFVRQSQSSAHREAVSDLCHEVSIEGHEIIYSSSFTIAKKFRSPENGQLIKPIMAAITASEMVQHPGAVTIGGAVIRFKMDEEYARWGYQKLDHDGDELPAITKDCAGGEPLYFVVMKQPSPYAHQCIDLHDDLMASAQYLSSAPNYIQGSDSISNAAFI